MRATFIGGKQHLPEPGSELLPGLAVGDVRALNADLDAAVKVSMLSHLTPVSGKNFSGGEMSPYQSRRGSSAICGNVL